LNFASPLPSLAIFVECLALGWVVVAVSPFFRLRLAEAGNGRFEGVDGLRGFLALGVFLSHVVAFYFYYTKGGWNGMLGVAWGETGQTGVSLFFMITGFLFWGRVLRSRGNLDAAALYRSRIRRIVPMYIVSVLMVLAVVGVMSGFSLHSSPMELIRELRGWFSFGFMDSGDINGLKDAHIINPVYWTLAFEWVFYLALPFLALFARGPASIFLFLIALAFCMRIPVTLNFLFGALAALAVERNILEQRLRPMWMTPVPLAALMAALSLDFSLSHSALLFVFFIFVVSGNSLFGLLESSPAKLLGTISYSIYLVHAIVLFVVLRLAENHFGIGTLDAIEYWSLAGLAAALTVLISAFTYKYVEFPMIQRSAAVSGRSAGRLERALAS